MFLKSASTLFTLSCLYAAQVHASTDAIFSTVTLSEKFGRVLVMYTDPRQPENMLAGTAHGGLWRSADGGNAWQQADVVMHDLPVTAIAVQPYHPDIMYAGTGDGRSGSVASAGRGLFKSNDGGKHWNPLPLTDPQRVGEKWSHVLSLSVNTEGIILAATSNNQRNGFIFRSTDGGQTWGLLPVYDGSRVGKHNLVHKVRFDPENPNAAIFMDDFANITHSTDGGVTWKVVKKSSTCQ